MDRCNGCQLCAVACARLVYQKISWQASGIRIVTLASQRTAYQAIHCLACDEPSCAESCLQGALKARAGGGVTFDKEKCINCGACQESCPVDAISSDKDGTYHCVHCGKCVDFCKQGCLEMQESLPDE